METKSEKIIKDLSNSNIDWVKLSSVTYLPESFIREFSDKVDWIGISEHQDLSEDFIREFQDRLN